MFTQSLLAAMVAFATLFGSPFAGIADGCVGKPPTRGEKIEVAGKLATGLVAIGGETTGVTLTAGRKTWELDLGNDSDLLAAAKKLDGQNVTVTGTAVTIAGVEIPARHIIRVATLKPAKRP